MKNTMETRNPIRHVNAQIDRAIDVFRSGNSDLAGLAVLLIGLVLLFSVFLPDSFPRPSTLQAMMFQVPELGLLSLAMAIPLISGGLNLAVVATANQAGLLMAWILTTQMPPDAAGATLCLWIAIALVAGLVLCLIIGAVTGLIVAKAGAHPILVTLGTQTLIGGISVWLTRGKTLSGFPEPLLAISNSTLLGVPISFLIFCVVAAVVHVLLTATPTGIRIHMIGSNLQSTRYSGVNTDRVQLSVYVWSSVLCWLAAIIMMARFNSAGADIAQSYLLITVLASILGGIDPYGGFGRVGGLVLALFVLQTIASGFNLAGVNQQLTLAFWGMTLLGVMAFKRILPHLRYLLPKR
jgi:simple sugar transport system permease protein